MTWFDWFLVAWWIFATVLTVTTVGKTRRPLEPSTAAGAALINIGFIALLLWTNGALG